MTVNRYRIEHKPDPENAPGRPWIIFDTFEERPVAYYRTEAECHEKFASFWRKKGLQDLIPPRIVVVLALALLISTAALAGGRQGETRAGSRDGIPNGDDVRDPGHVGGGLTGGNGGTYGGGGDPGAQGAGRDPHGPPGSW